MWKDGLDVSLVVSAVASMVLIVVTVVAYRAVSRIRSREVSQQSGCERQTTGTEGDEGAMSASNVRSVTTLLEIFDMATSLAFYRALGCEVEMHWGEQEDESEWDWVLLRLGNAALMLNTRYERDERPSAPEPGRMKGHADTELFFNCEDVDLVCGRLRDNGLSVPEPMTTFYGARRVCLTDPDGFVVCFEAPAARGLSKA